MLKKNTAKGAGLALPGLQDQKIMEAIYESARTNKSVQLERIEKPDAFRGTMPTKG